MNKSNIHHLRLVRQDTKEGIYMTKGISLTRLVHNLIREYGTYRDGSYYVDVLHLTLSDKKLVLSHILDSEEYAWACESPTRTEALFLEHIDYVQGLFDWEYGTVYAEDMEEMGLVSRTHYDNGEVYWVRR
jgi:hypothetical protein